MGKKLKDVQLELSLKPFPSARTEDIEAVTLRLIELWRSLLRDAELISFLLWTGDGTELLEYDRDMGRVFPWALYIGRGSDRHRVSDEQDPLHESLDGYPRNFIDHPQEYKYGDLKRIVQVMKSVAERETGLPVRIGTILDPGGEFIKSDWKYERHPEILFSGQGHLGFNIDCTAKLHADPVPYAGFPKGIPEGTPWGTFFGRQAAIFMKDMGFEYLWLSNGFGMGRSPYAYGACGEFFDGSTFFAGTNRATKAKILEYWDLFHAECPKVPIRLRGTDYVVGMDLINHAVPYRELLSGCYNTVQPPNTPWPALTSNFGMALTGYLGRMSVAQGDLPFRHYTSDPWWANSAWVDAFNRSPHDIYLNLSLSAVQSDGSVKTADRVDFLSVDTSWGELPEWIPDEVIPHIKAGFRNAPDQAGPLVWVYPFDEYEAMAYGSKEEMAEVFAGDLFFQEAMNNFLPVNSVISSKNFIALRSSNAHTLSGRVFIVPVPPADSPLEKALLSQLRAGGSILLYGSLARASATLLSMLCIKNSEALEGDFELQGLGDAPAAGIGRGNSAGSGGVGVGADVQPAGTDATMIRHQSAISAGGLTEVDALAAANRVGGGSRTGTGCDGTPLHTVTVRRRGAERIIARACALSNGRGGAAPRATDSAGGSSPGVVAWVRTISSVDLEAGGLKTRSMKPFAEGRFYRAEKLVRKMLRFTGYELALDRERPAECARHIAVSRHRNGFRFTLFSEERGMKVRLRFPLGAPILEGEPVELRNGAACYRFHRFLYAECRLFLKSNDGDFVECEIVQSLSFRFKHRINLTGLKNATVCFFPPDGDPEKAKVLLNPDLRLLTIGDDFESTTVSDGFGVYQEIRNVTGILSFAY